MISLLIDTLSDALNNTSMVTFFLSMFPITELRFSLPWAIVIGGIRWEMAFLLSYLGNFIVTIPILLFFNYMHHFLLRFKIFKEFFKWLFKRTEIKAKIIKKYQYLGLLLFVGIPLPLTGVWTGCIATFIFKMDSKKAIFAMGAGLLISASIMTLVTLSGMEIYKFVN